MAVAERERLVFPVEINGRVVNIVPMMYAKKTYEPDPKPEGRIVDKANLGGGRAKVEQENRCRIPGCRARWPFDPLDPHHLVQRSLGGDDVAANIIPLCRIHHDELKHPTRSQSVRERIRLGLSKTEILYIRGKKGKDWLDKHYPSPLPEPRYEVG